MSALQRLTLLWRRFSPLEQQLLESVRQALPSQARAAFDAQVAGVTRVQRLPHWTEIAFYRLRRGSVDWSGIPLFPRTEEFPLAEVRFRAAGHSYKARLTAIAGHVFDFAITPGPRAVAFARWEAEPEVRLLESPENAGAPTPAEPVPERWRELLARPPVDLDDWALHPESEVYRVTLKEGAFLVLAERGGDDFLLYRVDPMPFGFFVQHGHDCSPEPFAGDPRAIFNEQ